MYGRILLPIEDSGDADDPAARAIELADEHDAELHAVYVVDTRRTGEPALSGTEALIERSEAEGTKELARLGIEAKRAGVEYAPHESRGNPDEEILDHARRLDADAIVLDRDALHHSTLAAVRRHAEADVVEVR